MPKPGYGFSFNGIKSDNMGVWMVWYPNIPRAAKNMREVKVPGKHGKLHISDGSYEPISFEFPCRLTSNANRETVASWLAGSGDLIFDEEPDRAYKAFLTPEIEFERFMPLSMAADFDVYVDAQPHRYESSPQLIALTSPGVITNPGSVPSEPVLTVMGSGDIALLVAGQTVLIAGLQYEIIIDCEAKLAYKNNLDGTMTLLTNSVTLPDDEWPTMPSGPVPVSWAGNVTEVEIRGNWRWL